MTIIEALVDLQEVDGRIRELELELKDLPRRKALETARLSGVSADLQAAKANQEYANQRVKSYEEDAKALKDKALDFVIFGDSITMGWTYPAAHKYSGGKEIWEREFGKLKTANFGVSGDRCEHVLWRATAGGQADGWKAKTIFLMIGINDYLRTDGWQVSAEDYERNLRYMVTNSLALNPNLRIILCEPFRLPVDTNPDFVRRQRSVRAVAEEYNLAFVPFQKLFSDRPASSKAIISCIQRINTPNAPAPIT